METKDELHRIRTSPSQRSETADLGPACWFIVSRRALAPVAACGEATKPGQAPNGSLNQQSLERGTQDPKESLAHASG